MKIELDDRLEAVDPDAWDRLHAASRQPAPFLSWAWQGEWLRAFAAHRRVELRRVTDRDGTLVAVLPLYEEAPGRLTLVGGADVSDYLDLLAVRGREEEAWTALLGSRAASRDVWELHAVPAASPTVGALPALARAYSLAVTVTVEERCPVLDLPATWDAYWAGLPGKHRHELSRKARRLEREAPGARATCVSAPGDVEARLDDFLRLHRASRAGKAKFMDETMAGFFRATLGALAARGQARLWFLDLPDGPIAAFVTLEWGDTVGLYNSGFVPERAALAPGLVLLTDVVRDAIARGRRRFDFMRGEERYKYEFGPSPEEVCLVRVGPA